ncbi:hypothetical protein FHX81_7608 [Saccharothrix saharensis]|uniref:LysR substrate binding domain-containing protein n=1 Tax=Saccharothrix saharensis TaxID=571190 RepID=A0A543JQL3_9PSEU|nr:hypothetical protein [Saccharothrix saharensis]TQM85137.1 hypothetical protein FHX81_7608 [Saccharothrix saharensis]
MGDVIEVAGASGGFDALADRSPPTGNTVSAGVRETTGRTAPQRRAAADHAQHVPAGHRRLCGWGEHPALPPGGDADAALVHEPFDRTGLDAETIAVERRVAAVPIGPRRPRATRSASPSGTTSATCPHYPLPGVADPDVPDAPPATLVITRPPQPRQRRSSVTAALVRAATAAERLEPNGGPDRPLG